MATVPYKRTSQLLHIGASVSEQAPATFSENEIELPLSSLDREIFVVTDIDLSAPQHVVVAGVNVVSDIQLTKTSQTGLIGINHPTVLGKKRITKDNNVVPVMAVTEESHPNSLQSTGTTRDFLGIIATPSFFIQAWTQGGTAPTTGNARITGFRARASADLYAALVTEELNF